MTTNYRAIENADGSIQLHDLYNDDLVPFYEPCLEFNKAKVDDYWDNSEFLLKYFRGLKKNKKSSIEDLESFCKQNNFNYQNTLRDLLEIYKTSKKLKFWQKK